MQIVNPQTGETMELVNGAWVSVGGTKAKAPAAPAGQPERLTSGAVNAALVSAGDQLTTIGRNARDMFARFRGDEAGQLAIANERDEADRWRANLREEAPIASAVGAMLPSLATMPIGMGIGGAGVLAGGLGRAATNVGMGAGMGALSAEGGDLAEGATVGGAFGLGGSLAGNMIARVKAGREAGRAARQAAAVPGALDEAQQGVIDGARRAGLSVTPGQATGDRTMRQIEASASSNPVLSPYWQELKAGNQRQINTLAARAMGVDADNVGPAVRAAAETQIGKQFQEIGERIGQVQTAPLKKKLAELAQEESTALLPRVELESILQRFERGFAARQGAVAGGGEDVVTGAALMRERSRIAGQMRDAFARNDSTAGRLYADVVDAIDDSVKASAAGQVKNAAEGFDVARAYDRARDQWSVLRAMDRGGATIDGQVLPGQASRILSKSDASRFVGRADETTGQTLQRTGTGTIGQDTQGDLYDALRFASSQIGKDIVGDSGTATRLATSGIFEGGALATAGRGASYAARRMVAGPLARRYMAASPAAAAAWTAAAQKSALAGWSTGQAAGGAAARTGQGVNGIPMPPERLD